MDESKTTEESAQPESGPSTERDDLRFSELQEALKRALAREGEALVTIYVGALYVLQQVANPDRLALASHNFRELLDKILRVRADVRETTVSLKPKVMNLRQDWDSAGKATSCLKGEDSWTGDIDEHLGGFLRKVRHFFKWFDQHYPTQRQEIADGLQGFDRIGLPLPSVLEELNVDYWEKIRTFFVRVAHHGRTVDDQEFARWQYACERFLVERLQPPTFQHHAELDSLIQEAETHDS